MALYGKQAVINWFERSGHAYFWIYQYGKESTGNYAYHSDLVPGASKEIALEDLKRTLDFITGKYEIVATKDENRTPKGGWKETMEISQQERGPQQPNMYAVSGISPDEVETRITAALNNYKQETELQTLRDKVKDLEKENRELQKETTDPWNKIAGVLTPFLPGILGQKAVAGLPPGTDTPPSNEHVQEDTLQLSQADEQRLGNVIAILHSIAPDQWLNKLEKLAAMVQANPAMLNMLN